MPQHSPQHARPLHAHSPQRTAPLARSAALARALALAPADEREVCAVLAVRLGTFIDPDDGPVTRPLAEEIAAAIRARGKETKA